MDLASSLAVIGWFVQVPFDKGMNFAIDHWGGAGAGPDFRAALERLWVELNKVRALLPIAQKIRSENEGLLEYVKDLKDAAYDAEDIFSELEYYRLQKEVEGKAFRSFPSSMKTAKKKAGGFLYPARLAKAEMVEGKAIRSFRSSMKTAKKKDIQASTSSPPPSVVDSEVTIVTRIYEVVARLDRIITGVRRLLPLLKLEEGDLHVSPGDRVTTSFVSSNQTMFGREETKAQIIHLLLNGQPAAASDVCVLPIIGVGGIGKTTLARAVYNNKQVVEHFDCTLWLYVSENFDVPRLTREMLESLGVPGSNNITNLDQLQKLLTEKLRSKKFLLVMDDVWNDTDSRKWDMLCAPLEFGKPGSRILLTTRLDTVVRMVGKTIDVLGCSIKLKGLPEKELLSLFNKCAFGNEEPSNHPDLAKIGKQIAGKLGGSPLAAKTVGSLLNEKLNVEHWRSILSSDIWKLPQCPDDIMPVLKLSYQHLPVQLQLCFAYCCVFPKGGYFNGLQLVRMWIAHGYIDAKTSGTKSMEDIGWEYFKTLSARSFFEDFGDDSDSPDYNVHDLFHDLAQSVSADECFIIERNNQQVPRSVRHLSLSSDHMALSYGLIVQKSYLRKLRTLIIKGYVDAELFAEMLSELKSVRVICILDSYLPQLLHNMGHLIHLRYLHVDNYEEEWRVPDSLGRLYQLQYTSNASNVSTKDSASSNVSRESHNQHQAKKHLSLLSMDLASSLAVIGWFVQVLFDKGMTFAIDHWGGPDFRAALERLWEELNKVRALLPIAQKIRSENEGLLEYVKDLKDAAYDAEDIFSELEYYRLQEEVEGNENSNNSSFASSMIEAAGGFLSQLRLTNEDSQASTSSPPPSVVDNKVTIIDRIIEVVDRLNRIFTGMSKLLPLLKLEEEDSHVSPGDRVTTSFVSSKQPMFGREETKAQIIDLLLNGQPADVCVLPIIGAGGIGKTTLARAVYNSKQVAEHFDCTLWQYVSDNFDVPRLTREMLESLGVPDCSHIKNLDKLQKLLKENLRSKKFLLVLDDVWNDTDRQKWDMLCGSLEYGKAGSRILLTTRLDTVVRMVGRSIGVLDRSFKLTGLPMEELLSLFNKCAFGDEEPSDHPYLAEIGKKIAGKLGGSPLAAKTVGSLLNENLDAEHWRSILSSDIWRLPQRHDDIMPVLKLSYQHLPVQLQLCFAYCCVFPKGGYFNGLQLVRMWIAHGYIDAKTSGNKSMEDIGREYFKILSARSFFEAGDGNWQSYVVHDLFHDLAQSISADECFKIDINNQEVPRRVRHLSLSSYNMDLVVQKSYLSNLRTLFITFFDDDVKLFAELLSGLKSVRVIYILSYILSSEFKELPHNMGHLIHLRYLYLYSYVRAEWRFPDSLGRLYQLQYAGNGTGKFWEVKSLILPAIEKLTRLQQLDHFVIEGGRKIGELKNLNQLGGLLELENLENVHTKEEALEAELSKKMHIQNLILVCNDSHTSPEVAEEVFEGLRPPAYIKDLTIEGYGGVNSPTWMVHEIRCFCNLESLSLFNCLKWKVLPPLGQLPFLSFLRIRGADAVEVIDKRFYGTRDAKGFPCLETLEFSSMPQLVVWSGIGEDPGFLFPRLVNLAITNCPKLEKVPTIDLTSLTKLITNYMPLLLHPENLSSLKLLVISACEELQSLPVLPTSLEELKIKDCPQLLTLFTTEHAKTMSKLRILDIDIYPRLMSAELKSLPSLKQAYIYSRNMPLLPATLEKLTLCGLMLTDLNTEQEEKLSDLTSLRELNIYQCPHLNSLPLLPASLKELIIYNCPQLRRERERYRKGGDEWNKVSHIPRIGWAHT